MRNNLNPFTSGDDDDGPTIELHPGQDMADEFDELRRKAEKYHNHSYDDDELFVRLIIVSTYQRLNKELEARKSTDDTDTENREPFFQ